MTVAALLAGAHPCPAQREPAVQTPPMAAPATLEVPRGGRVAIPLRAQGRTPGTIRFLVRSAPAHGRLGEIRRTGRTTAEVIYEHSGAGGGWDSFRYAAQAVDSPVSASAEVRLVVVDPPAEIVGPGPVDFGRVALGSRSRREIEFRNRGGTPARLSLRVAPPWFLEDDADRVLGPGGSVRIGVSFEPARPGEQQSVLQADGFPRASVPVSGSGFQALSVRRLEGGTDFEVVNETNARLPLAVVPPPGWITALAPEWIEPGQAAVVTLAPQGEPRSGTVEFRAGAFSRSVPMDFTAAPPRLVGPGRIDFGELAPGQRVTRSFRLSNEGGSPARLEAALPDGVVVVPGLSATVLPPGDARDFEMAIERTEPGPFSLELAIEAEGAEPLRITLEGRLPSSRPVREPSAGRAGDADGPARGIPTRELLRPEIVESDQPPESAPESGLPAPTGFRQHPAPTGTVILSWDDNSPSAAGYILEARAIEFAGDDEPPRIRWNPWPRTSFERRGGEVFLTVPGAIPNSSWLVRARAVEKDGRRSAPSEIIRLEVPPRPRPPWPLIAVAVLAVGGALGWLWHRSVASRRAGDLEEARRIARLEDGG